MVRQGDVVEWFSASFPGAPAEEVLEGVRMVRAGRQWTVHWAAFRHYRGRLSQTFDAVVDQVNTIPFFTPLWANIPTIALIHQLAREVWWYESKFPLSLVGFLVEPAYLRLYRHVPILTVSASTREDLRRLGFSGDITIIPEGIEPIENSFPDKANKPTFLYVGRLAPSKRICHMLEALAKYRRATGNGTLWLVGSGARAYQRSLSKLARRLKIEDSVMFLGRVSAQEKHFLMAKAHALLMTSVREGWGLVVTEANACGTPAVVYDVPGLRDSVRHEATGLVVATRPGSLSDGMIRVTTDPLLYARLASEGRLWSATMSFDETTRQFRAALNRALAA